MKKRDKRASAARVVASKAPQARPPAANSLNPRWSFVRVDHEGPWPWDGISGDRLVSLMKRLADLERATWAGMGQAGSHFVAVGRIAPEAQRRLPQLQLDDVDELFSARIGARGRIWGTRVRDTLFLMWWDPEHRVCPGLDRR